MKEYLAEYKKMDKWTEFLDLPPADAQFVGTLQKGMGGGVLFLLFFLSLYISIFVETGGGYRPRIKK